MNVGSGSAVVLLDNAGIEPSATILNTGPDTVYIGPSSVSTTSFPLAANTAMNMSELLKGMDLLYGICGPGKAATVAVFARTLR